jgi:hypothetical protein
MVASVRSADPLGPMTDQTENAPVDESTDEGFMHGRFSRGTTLVNRARVLAAVLASRCFAPAL